MILMTILYLGEPGTPFTRLAQAWRAMVRRDGRKERDRKAKIFRGYYQAKKRGETRKNKWTPKIETSKFHDLWKNCLKWNGGEAS